jgi:hypothetical protein
MEDLLACLGECKEWVYRWWGGYCQAPCDAARNLRILRGNRSMRWL